MTEIVILQTADIHVLPEMLGPLIHPAAGSNSSRQNTAHRAEAWWSGARPNTRRAFLSDIAAWHRFCATENRCVLPARPVDIRDFIRSQTSKGLRAVSISRQLASLTILHTFAASDVSPVADAIVRGEMKATRHAQADQGRGRARQAKALRLKGDVEDVSDDFRLPFSVEAFLETLNFDKPLHLRDAVLLRVGADLGRRRSELSALDMSDIGHSADGSGTALIRRSKTDADGAGSLKYLSYETMLVFQRWAAMRRRAVKGTLPADAPLLTSIGRSGRIGERLAGNGISYVLQTLALRALRLQDPKLDEAMLADVVKGLSGHSFRVGFAQDLMASGETMAAIQQAGDWKSAAMAVRYAEALAARSGARARFSKKVSAARAA